MNRRVIEKLDDWEAMRARFRWDVPERFNIAERCCDSWAAKAPDRLAIRHIHADGRREDRSYGRLKADSDALAASLAAQGIGRGDRVAVLLAQCPEVMVTHFATQKLGAIILPLFTLFGPDALDYRLRDSGAKAVVTDCENVAKVLALTLPDLTAIYCIGGAAGALDFARELAANHPPAPIAETRAEDPAVLIYTSGTTGPPKGVLHAHRFLLGHLPSIETSHAGFPQPGDCGWTPADWAWIGGLMDMAIPCLYFGVPLISHRMRKFDAGAAYALIAREAIRNLFLPPTALKLMRGTPVPEGVNIRTISSGGEALGAELLRWGQETLGAPINEIYGQTECNLIMASCHGQMPVRPGSMGKPVPGFEAAIIDAAGQPVPPGTLGEIAVKRGTPVMFLEYWGKPEKTAEKFTGGWMRTGDLGTRDADGYFTYVSRDDDIITSAGYRVGPTEIENCLMGHPDVVMAAAVGVPDPVKGEAIKGVVVLREGASPDGLDATLIARVRDRISPHVAPKLIEFRDHLPMTATGKIMRRELRR